jgi:hypothetical protein
MHNKPGILLGWFIKLAPALLAMCLVTQGCASLSRGKIKAGSTVVEGIPDAGKPATLATDETKSSIAIPAGTEVSVTKIESSPATASTPFIPARWVSVFTPTKDTRLEAVSATLRADTGTVDTSVAKHRIDAQERRWLLWCAMACGIGGIISRSMLPAWPAISNGLILAAVLSGLAWKLSEIPPWTWLIALGAAVLLVMGYKRAEWDKNGDGIPDILQKKP